MERMQKVYWNDLNWDRVRIISHHWRECDFQPQRLAISDWIGSEHGRLTSHRNCDEHGKLKAPLLTSDLRSDYSGGSGSQRLQKAILKYSDFQFPNGIVSKTWRVQRWKHIEIVISDRWLFASELWQVDRIRAMEFCFESELYGLWSPISIEAGIYVLKSIYVD